MLSGPGDDLLGARLSCRLTSIGRMVEDSSFGLGFVLRLCTKDGQFILGIGGVSVEKKFISSSAAISQRGDSWPKMERIHFFLFALYNRCNFDAALASRCLCVLFPRA